MFEFELSIIFLIIGYLAYLFVAKLHNPVHMLIANIASCWITTIYLVLNDAMAGAAVCVIAGLASLAQIFLYKSKRFGNPVTRNVAATVFTIIAVSILYQKPSDLLPCIAFVQSRFLEARVCAQSIKLSVFLAAVLWAGYAMQEGLYFMMVLELSVGAYALICMIQYRQKTRTSVQSAHSIPAE